MLCCFGSVVGCVGWPQQAAEPHTAPPLHGMWERIGRAKVRRLGGRDKDTLISKGRGRSQIEIKKNKRCKSSHLLPADLCPASLPKQWQPLQNSSPVLLLSMAVYGREYPFHRFRSAALAVLPPSLLSAPSLLTMGAEWEREKALTLCKLSPAVTHGCVINSALVANPKYGTVQAARKEINFIPAGPSTGTQLPLGHLITPSFIKAYNRDSCNLQRNGKVTVGHISSWSSSLSLSAL